MKTLVTGASGFIGRALLRQNLSGDIHVVSRNFSLFPAGITVHSGDLGNFEFVEYLGAQKFDRIIHLAWEGLPNLSEENNLRNLNISQRLLEVLASSGVKDFHVSGSCLEYGEITGSANERMIGKNLSNFASSKMKLLEFLTGLGVAYKWHRIFYAYGPHQHEKSLLSSAFSNATKGALLGLDNPSVLRDFVFVSDVANAIALLIDKPDANGVFNIGSGEATRVEDLVNTLYTQMGLEVQDRDIEQSTSLTADVRKIHETCGWLPDTPIEDGVKSFLDWKYLGGRN
jgi:nucleoside-diphosphate-sugar epimerase